MSKAQQRHITHKSLGFGDGFKNLKPKPPTKPRYHLDYFSGYREGLKERSKPVITGYQNLE